jgi:hypothetical protein
MAQSKLDKQQKALERLTSKIADDLANSRTPTFSDRQEYNKLKGVLAKAGRTHEGRI